MFKKELCVVAFLGLIVFLAVGLTASWTVGMVQKDAKRVAEDIVPGLAFAGQAVQQIGLNWTNTNRLLSLRDLEQRRELAEEVRANGSDAYWKSYDSSIFCEDDRGQFDSMVELRNQFLVRRELFFKTALAMDDAAAAGFLESELSPAYDAYQSSAKALFDRNSEVGVELASRIALMSRWTPLTLGSFCVLIFGLGVFVGFKASIGAFRGDWRV